jgi:diaminohydroxyphosphoribosylaminopyrimidine deaminase/5-amino-6-(5-phosphoribosylamino)uracil reductase
VIPNFPKSASSPHSDDTFWMNEALKESLKGVGITNPNPAIGCILVDKTGKEISRGFTQGYPGIHAERAAFQKVSHPELLDEATAYVTLEPCSHHGNQPPCVDLIVHSKIKRVVVARMDPNPLVAGEGLKKLIKAGKQVEVGLFHFECTAWNLPFFTQQVFKRPVIGLKWAQTLDGQLADDRDISQWISGAPARAYTHWLRQRYDSILVGAKTVLSDFPKLSVRDCSPPHQRHPLPIIFDPRGRCGLADPSIQDRLLETTFHSSRKMIYITTRSQEKTWNQSKLSRHSDIHPFFLKDADVLSELKQLLYDGTLNSVLGRSLQSIFVEGGAQTLSLFLREGMGDCFHVFISPLLTGGVKNRVQLFQSLSEAQRYTILSSSQLGSDILVELVTQDIFQQLFQTPEFHESIHTN